MNFSSSDDHSLPTFLGIGSMRCGSTWLYQALRCHPDIQVGEFKEVDFFFMHRMLRYDLNWYEGLFGPHGEGGVKSVRGEISPGYARLKGWQVNRIAKLLPSLRILLTLRNPIERVWSQTLYTFGHLSKRDVREVGTVAFLRQVDRTRSRLSSDYARIIAIWTRAFGPDALHISFFDRLQNDPDGFIKEVLAHIGASTSWQLPAGLGKERVWATNTLVSQERSIPEIVKWYIADRLLEPTERLNDMLGGRVSHWVNEMRSVRGESKWKWRFMGALNRTLFSAPERAAYEAYHFGHDARMWSRWLQITRSYGRCPVRPSLNACSEAA